MLSTEPKYELHLRDCCDIHPGDPQSTEPLHLPYPWSNVRAHGYPTRKQFPSHVVGVIPGIVTVYTGVYLAG